MNQLMWICLAGAAGTGVRRLVGIWAPRWLGATFPWATLIVNVLGCFIISFVAQVAAKRLYSDDLRLALMTGFCGGLTTYSSLNFETTDLLFGQRALVLGALNVVATVVLCFGAGVGGAAAGRALVGT
jgi:fluoride exporter